MPLAILPWLLGGAGLLGVGAFGWKAGDEIGEQIDKARPYLIGLAALYIAATVYKRGR